MKPTYTEGSEPEIPPEGGHGFNMPVVVAIVVMIALAIVVGLIWT